MSRALTAAFSLLALVACDDQATADADAPVADAAADAAPDAAAPAPPRLAEIACREAWVEVQNPGALPLYLNDYALLTPRGPLPLQGTLAPGERRVLSPGAFYCGEPLSLGDAAYAGDLVPEAATAGRFPEPDGPFVPTEPTPGEPNRALTEPGAALFLSAAGPTFEPALQEIDLTLAPGAAEWLGGSANPAVNGTVKVGDGPAQAATFKLYGLDGRFRRLDQKPSLHLRFDVPDSPGALMGLPGLDLEAAPLDRSGLATWLCAELLRAAGVPAPRVGLARVRLDGAPLGLYSVVEPVDAFTLARRFPSTGHLYRGLGAELLPDQVAAYLAVLGPESKTADLVNLADLVQNEPDRTFWAATRDFVDWPSAVRLFAAELALGLTESYAPSARNTLIHFDLLGRATFLPSALDAGLSAAPKLHAPQGALLNRCLAEPRCAALYDEALASVLTAVADPQWLTRARQVAALIKPEVATDPRTLWSLTQHEEAVAAKLSALAALQALAPATAACLMSDAPDPDGDGAPCDQDCAPDDPSVFPGAPEVCGDGVDQDCSGQADDAAECDPDCAETTLLGRPVLRCPTPRTLAEAKALCVTHGRAVFSPGGAAEAGALAALGAHWLGLHWRNDTLTTLSGEAPPYLGFATSPPEDASAGAPCVSLEADGTWKMVSCEAKRAVLCASACDPQDQDGDGALTCGQDCDDQDPALSPGQPELCGDGLDQSCAGLADAGCDCRGARWGGHRYLICPERVTYVEAKARCQAQGMALPILNDPGEAEWLFAESRREGGRYWVGLSDGRREGRFTWWDGTAPRSPLWSRGEPNDASGAEDCVHFLADAPEWNDVSCDTRLSVLCESF